MSATTQKPLSVIDAISNYYKNHNSNIHREVHQLAEEATIQYESTREKVRKFINARSQHEIIFTRNTTEAINLIAYSWGLEYWKNDCILITEFEHHSNIVPWQMLAQEKNCNLEYVGMDEDGNFDLVEYQKELINLNRVKLVSISQMSNVLGTIVPINRIIKMAHEVGIPVLVDAGAIGSSYGSRRPRNGLRVPGLLCS